MARYRVIYWREIPSLVEAFEGDHAVRASLSQRFQELVDAVAMREGASGADAYLEGWQQGPEGERPGTPESVAERLTSELEAGFEDFLRSNLRNSASDPA
ncbi:MAG: virulence factor [Candidatus Methylomirabilia bacterium]